MSTPYINLPDSLDDMRSVYPPVDPRTSEFQLFDEDDFLAHFPLECNVSPPRHNEEAHLAERLFFFFAEVCFFINKGLNQNNFSNFDILAEKLGETYNCLELFCLRSQVVGFTLHWEVGYRWVQLSLAEEETSHSLWPYLSDLERNDINQIKSSIRIYFGALDDPDDTLLVSPIVKSIKGQMLRLYHYDKCRRPSIED